MRRALLLIVAAALALPAPASAHHQDAQQNTRLSNLEARALALEAKMSDALNRIAALEARVSKLESTPTPTPTPSATPTPTPTATATPTPTPTPTPSVGFPDASNTGPVASQGCTQPLVPRSGLTVTQDGTVIENSDITGEVVVQASNVTIRCSRIRFSGLRGVTNFDGGGTLIDRVDIGGTGQSNCDGTVAGTGYTLRRVNLHDCEDGAKVGTGVTVEDSYVHDMALPSGAHADGLQLMGCCSSSGSSTVTSGVVIRRNNIQPRPYPSPPVGASSGATSSIIVKSDFGRIDDVLVTGNRLACGAFIVYSRSGSYEAPTNVRFTGNTIGRCYEFGVKSFDGSPTWSGNVWEDTGAEVP